MDSVGCRWISVGRLRWLIVVVLGLVLFGRCGLFRAVLSSRIGFYGVYGRVWNRDGY